MTQSDLADLIGCTYAQVGRLETGERELTIGWMRRVGRALGVDAGALLLPDDNRQDLSEGERIVLDLMRHGDAAAVRMLVDLAHLSLKRDDADADDAGRRAPANG